MNRRLPYSIPKITRATGDWFVRFSYEYPDNPGKFKEFRVRDGVNYVHDLKKKEEYIVQLRDEIEYALEHLDFNPFEDQVRREQEVKAAKQTIIDKKVKPKSWTLTMAMAAYKKHYENQGNSRHTLRSYDRYMRLFGRWVEKHELQDQLCATFTEMQLEEFLQETGLEQKWSNRTYNNYQDALKTFLIRSELLERRINRGVKYEAVLEDLKDKKTTPERNAPLPPKVLRNLLKEFEKEAYRNLGDYAAFIFLCLMRPFEIQKLTFYDIDEQTRQITLIGKGNIARIVPISDYLLKLINKRKGEYHEDSWHPFGMGGNSGPLNMSLEYFRLQWTELRKALKLPAKYTLYSFKHTGVIALLNAGFTDDQVMALTGHRTLKAFEAYKRGLFIDKSHAMKGETVDFWSF